jgi:predicted NBD/HSP70 family sugar kinase
MKESAMTGKPRILKENNRRLVLDLLRKSDAISVAEISAKVDLSKTTVMKIIDYLVRTGIALPAGKGHSTEVGGKKPTMFRFNERAGYVIAVHIFTDEIYSVICDLHTTILFDCSSPLKEDESLAAVLAAIVSSCQKLMRKAGIDAHSLLGIGIGTHGITNTKDGILYVSPHFPSWGTNIRFRDLLEEQLPFAVPITLENNCRMQAIAEKIRGIATDKRNIVAVEAGTGLGSGIIVQDEIKWGVHYLSGEIGHMVINPKTEERCACGGRGCFEVMVSTKRLLRLAKESYQEHPDSVIFQGGQKNMTAEGIFDAANAGDTLARALMDDIISWFAIGFSNVIVMYDPEIIIIQGVYTRAGDYFLENLREKVNEVSLVRIKKDVQIEYSRFGKERGVIGSAAHIISEYFQEGAFSTEKGSGKR